jgi:nucleoside-diphosphate kinase
MKLSFYPSDNSVELFNVKTNKLFLKKTPYPQLKKNELVIGGTITIFARQFTIIDYADHFTRQIF